MSHFKEVFVAVGTYDSTVICLSFDAEQNSLERKFQLKGHSGSVRTVASTRQWLASGSTDETIKLYDFTKCCEIGSLLHHEGSISWLAFTGNQMVSASEDGTIAVWQTGNWNCSCTLTGHKGPVSCVTVHQSGKLALSVGRDRILRTWNLSTGYLVFRQKLKEAAQIVKWSPCGKLYALGYRTTIDVYSVESGVVILSVTVEKVINSFIFIQDDVLAVASDSQVIQMFSIPSGKCCAKLEGHTQRVKGLAIWDYLFSVSSDGSIRVWKLFKPLKESVCVTVYDTGCRLNCITVSPTVMQKQATNSSRDVESQEVGTVCCDDDQKLGEKSRCQLMENVVRSGARAVKRARHHRMRRHRILNHRGTKLPISHRKVLSGRRCRQRLIKMPPVQ